jgi:hypothetical protein
MGKSSPAAAGASKAQKSTAAARILGPKCRRALWSAAGRERGTARWMPSCALRMLNMLADGPRGGPAAAP